MEASQNEERWAVTSGRAELHEVVARGRAPDRSNRWACSLWRVCFKRGSKGRRGPLMALIRARDGRWWPSWGLRGCE
eukprot:3654937-Prymnesium_polylepis.1